MRHVPRFGGTSASARPRTCVDPATANSGRAEQQDQPLSATVTYITTTTSLAHVKEDIGDQSHLQQSPQSRPTSFDTSQFNTAALNVNSPQAVIIRGISLNLTACRRTPPRAPTRPDTPHFHTLDRGFRRRTLQIPCNM